MAIFTLLAGEKIIASSEDEILKVIIQKHTHPPKVIVNEKTKETTQELVPPSYDIELFGLPGKVLHHGVFSDENFKTILEYIQKMEIVTIKSEEK
jgi:hypothetical protein